jgi:hypothetical protein
VWCTRQQPQWIRDPLTELSVELPWYRRPMWRRPASCPRRGHQRGVPVVAFSPEHAQSPVEKVCATRYGSVPLQGLSVVRRACVGFVYVTCDAFTWVCALNMYVCVPACGSVCLRCA